MDKRWQYCDECENWRFEHVGGTGYCERCDDCCEFELPRELNDGWKPANVAIDHPYVENTGGGKGCGYWYPQGTYSLERDYRCGYPELDHRAFTDPV